MRLSERIAKRAKEGRIVDSNTLMAISERVRELELTLEAALTMYDIFADGVHSHPEIEAEPIVKRIKEHLK